MIVVTVLIFASLGAMGRYLMRKFSVNLFIFGLLCLALTACTNSSDSNSIEKNPASSNNSNSISAENGLESPNAEGEETQVGMVKCIKGECDETKEQKSGVLVPKYLSKGNPCTFGDKTYKDGERVTFYGAESVRHGTMCVSEIRICSNGKLSGNFKFPKCIVQEAGPQIPTAGQFEGIYESDGEIYVRGWGCQIGKKEPAKVVVVASSNPNPQGFQQGGVLFQGPTDQSSELAISDACEVGVSSGQNRFSVKVSEKQKIQFMGRYLSAFIVLPDGSWASLEKARAIEKYYIPEKVESGSSEQASLAAPAAAAPAATEPPREKLPAQSQVQPSSPNVESSATEKTNQ